VDVGFMLSSEDHGPRELVGLAVAAEDAGFTSAVISDHFHPWVGAQGSSPFVWTVLGGIAAATDLRLGTAVVCPTIRIHPAIIAHAAATTALQFEGRFFLGVGSGENLNEHVLGDRWPPAGVRLAMLEEAVEVMRRLWAGGQRTFHGTYYTVENAELYDLPDEPVPVYVSAFGPKALELAARIGDGYVGTAPDADLVGRYVEQAGAERPRVATGKACWAADEAEARVLAHRLWPNLGLPGELAQELPTPQHFEQAAELVGEEAVTAIPHGPDPERYVAAIEDYADAGYTELYLHNIGPHQQEFLDFFQREVRPRLG
jgi:G6PDH family F420-dependent oxidoreductase